MMQSARDKEHLFSVIVLTYLQRNFLNECLDSIFSQSYPNIELIVCDDSSADFDVEEVQEYIEEHRTEHIKSVCVFKQEHNVGIVHNAAKGVSLSHGEYFKLHAGDDLLYKEDCLEKMASAMKSPTINIIAARSRACWKDGGSTEHYFPAIEAITKMQNADAVEQFKILGTQTSNEYISSPAVFWKRSLYDAVGGFDLSYQYVEDWPMWLKVTDAGYQITALDEVTTIYRYGGILNDNNSDLKQAFSIGYHKEFIRLLKEIALPRFEQMKMKKTVFRCRQAIRCLEAKIDAEANWQYMSRSEHIAWRVRNWKLLLVAWLYRVRAKGISTNRKWQLKAAAVSCLMLYLNVEILPGRSADKVWAGLMLVFLIWYLIAFALEKGVRAINSVLKYR